MTENYVQIMVESLLKKQAKLDEIMDKCKEQAQILKEEKFSMDDFDRNVDEKAVLIQDLGILDIGFDRMYERVKEELATEEGKTKYRNEIKQMQELITGITERSVSVQTQENRNKQAVEAMFKKERDKIKSGKQGSKVALDYYKTMNQTKFVSPQFLDRKN